MKQRTPDQLQSQCKAGEPSKRLRIVVTDEEGTVLDSDGYEVPAGTRYVSVNFGQSPEPLAFASLGLGETWGSIRPALGPCRDPQPAQESKPQRLNLVLVFGWRHVTVVDHVTKKRLFERTQAFGHEHVRPHDPSPLTQAKQWLSEQGYRYEQDTGNGELWVLVNWGNPADWKDGQSTNPADKAKANYC